MSSVTGAGNFLDSFVGKHETYGTLDQYLQGEKTSVEEIYPDVLDTRQYYDAERGGFVDPRGSMTPQYTNPFWEGVGESPVDPVLDFFMIPKGWRGKVDPGTGDAYRTTGLDKVLVAQNVNPAGLITGAGAKGLVSAASTKLPALIAMAPVIWQGTTKPFKGQPSLDFVGSAKRGLVFGWGQYFSDRRSIAGGYTGAREFKLDGVSIDKLWNRLEKDSKKVYNKMQSLLDTKRGRFGKSLKYGRDLPKVMPWETPEYIALEAQQMELRDQRSIFMFINLHGSRWEEVLRKTYAGTYKPFYQTRPASGKRVLPEEEVDRLVAIGKDIWSQVVQTKGGVVHKWDVEDDLIGPRGEKLLDWNVQVKDHPKEIQDKIRAALKDVNLVIRGLPVRLMKEKTIDNLTGQKVYDLIRHGLYTTHRLMQNTKVISRRKHINNPDFDKSTSLHLEKYGLDGLRYQANTVAGPKAVGTWDADVTRNYVIWSQKLLDQMKKLGVY